MKNNQQGASEEMILYARVLERGMYAGLILMFVTFFIYLFGIIDPLIPLEHIDSFWNQPVQDYLIQINMNFLDGMNLRLDGPGSSYWDTEIF